MKIHLLLLPLLLVTSCMKQSEESKQVQAAEIDTINKKMNNGPQYQLTRSEYETLLASGLLSESEKEELKDLFH